MARQVVAVAQSTEAQPALLTYAAFDAADGAQVANTGHTSILLKNGDSITHVVVVASIADPAGRLGDLTVSLLAGQEKVIGRLDVDLFGNEVFLNAGPGPDTEVSVTVAAFSSL